MSVAWSERENGASYYSEVRIDRVKVLIQLAKKTLQSMPKVQNVFGFDISYEKRVPPIGAPNAALTPADIPEDIIYRL